jgi:hypothetical protein
MSVIDMNDLSYVAKIKSNIMNIYWQLSQENLCTKNEAAQDIISVISDIIELESNLQTKIISK